ncbi:MAG: LacI family DNA-binding transcriptional regulator [Planctomycetota bacterium]
MASIRQIAQEAGVSIATVSRVMNNNPKVSESLRQRVQMAANRRRSNPDTQSPKTNCFGVLYTTDRLTIGSPYDSAILQGMAEEMGADSMDIRLVTPSELMRGGRTLEQSLRLRGIQGVLIRVTADTAHHALDLVEADFPAVTVSDRLDHPKASYLAGSSRQASREAVEHLLSIGHEKIAIVNSRIPDTDHIERFEGYSDAMEAVGLTVEPHRVIRAWPNRRGGITAMNQLATERDRPTALFFADMEAAMGASKRAFELGLNVPGDISIVGVDDGDSRFFAYPTMTAVCQSAFQMGRDGTRMLQQLIQNPTGPPLREKAASWLEVHDSTGAPAPY